MSNVEAETHPAAKSLQWVANMLGGVNQKKGFPRTAAMYCQNGADTIESLRAQLTESQRREQAAVKDLESLMRNSKELCACTYCRTDQSWGCALRREPPMCTPKWRGPQDGKGEVK